jgi:cysteine desulfurase
MGVPESSAESAVRISLSFDNTEAEAVIVIEAIEKTVNQLRKVMN